MAQDVSSIYHANMEVIRKDIPALYELSQTAEAMLSKSAEKFQISVTPNGQDFRIPLEIAPPASFGAFSMAGGSLGTGNGYTTQQMYQTYFATSLAVDVNLNAMVATQGGSNTSVLNAWKTNLKRAMPSFQRMMDAGFHNTGGNTGQVATSTALTSLTYTLDTTNGANLIQVGMPLEILTSDGATWRTSTVSPDNLPTVASVDKTNRKITLTNAGGLTLASGDLFFFRGSVAAGSPPTTTWSNGLRYFHSTSSSGNLLGLSKASYDIMPNLVNVNGSLVPAHGYQAKAQVRQRRGSIPKGYKGLIHDAQAAQLRNLGLSITEIHQSAGSSFQATDLGAGMADTITFWDIEHKIDVHQDKTLVDWVLPSDNWCRVYGQEPDFHKSTEGKMIFEGRNSSGTVTAKWSFYITAAVNYACVDAAKEAVLYGCTIPSGY
jgi:hypothetical protein